MYGVAAAVLFPFMIFTASESHIPCTSFATHHNENLETKNDGSILPLRTTGNDMALPIDEPNTEDMYHAWMFVSGKWKGELCVRRWERVLYRNKETTPYDISIISDAVSCASSHSLFTEMLGLDEREIDFYTHLEAVRYITGSPYKSSELQEVELRLENYTFTLMKHTVDGRGSTASALASMQTAFGIVNSLHESKYNRVMREALRKYITILECFKETDSWDCIGMLDHPVPHDQSNESSRIEVSIKVALLILRCRWRMIGALQITESMDVGSSEDAADENFVSLDVMQVNEKTSKIGRLTANEKTSKIARLTANETTVKRTMYGWFVTFALSVFVGSALSCRRGNKECGRERVKRRTRKANKRKKRCSALETCAAGITYGIDDSTIGGKHETFNEQQASASVEHRVSPQEISTQAEISSIADLCCSGPNMYFTMEPCDFVFAGLDVPQYFFIPRIWNPQYRKLSPHAPSYTPHYTAA